MFDVSAVEVLRGPQGTILGKNIIAGAINVTTARPGSEFEGRISGLYTDETGEEKVELILSGPLTDNLAGRLAIMDRNTDGWVENTAPAAPDFGDELGGQDDQVIRGSLVWNVGDNMEIFIKAENTKAEVEGLANQLIINADSGYLGGIIAAADDLKISDETPVVKICGVAANRAANPFACGIHADTSSSSIDADNFVFKVDYDFENVHFTALTGVSEFESELFLDADYSNATVLDVAREQSFEQFSQEFRFASTTDGFLDWTAGVYYQANDYETNVNNFALMPLPSPPFPINLLRVNSQAAFKQEAEALSFFGEGTLNFTSDLRLVLGARWTKEEKEVDDFGRYLDPATGAPLDPLNTAVTSAIFGHDIAIAPNNIIDIQGQERKEVKWTFAGTLQYDYEDHQFYASVTEGYKAGGFDEASNALVTPEYEPEEAISYELGVKSVLADGAANLTAALFYVEYDNLQVSTYNGISFNVGNAAASVSKGIEVDGKWRVSEPVTLSGSVAYLTSTYDEFGTAACTENQADVIRSGCFQDLGGETTNFAPRVAGNINVDYVKPISDSLVFSGRIGLSYRDSMTTQVDNDPLDEVGSLTLWDARLALASADDTWEVALIGKNLNDKSYRIFSGDVPLVGGAHAGPAGTPRTISLQGVYNF